MSDDITEKKRERPDLLKLERWLRKTKLADGEGDDEIKNKATKARVLKQVARGIQRTNPTPKGRCSKCGNYDDRVVPVVIKCCFNCTKRMINNGGQLKIMKRERIENYCDICFGKSWTQFTVNPYYCQRCSGAMLRKYKYQAPEVKKQIGILNKKRPSSLQLRF